MHRAVVRDGQRCEFQIMRLVHQPIQTARAIEQGILGVQVQVNKIRVRHAEKLPFDDECAQERDVHSAIAP